MLYTQASEVSRADFCPRKPLRVVLAVALLANGKGDVAVLDHVLNLLSHYPQVSQCSVTSDFRVEAILVRTKRINQYMTRTGQKTGTLKISKKVQKKEMVTARVAQYQNLNSGRRRMKGLNSSSCLVGRVPTEPSSISLSRASLDGSNLG